ncbi:hypothetical protein JCM10213_002193 [Rhodosporidiobolus nylandii]
MPATKSRRLIASLDTLPDELKLRIIDFLRPPPALQPYHRRSQGQDPPFHLPSRKERFKDDLADLVSLGFVNRSFSVLASEALWQDLDLVWHSTFSILRTLDCLLPLHASHIRTLTLGSKSNDDFHPRSAQLSAHQERVILRRAKRFEPDQHERRNAVVKAHARDLLLSEVVRRCPQLEAVRVELCRPPDEHVQTQQEGWDGVEYHLADEWEWMAVPVDAVFPHTCAALRQTAAANLREVSLLLNQAVAEAVAPAAAFLRACRQVEVLEVGLSPVTCDNRQAGTPPVGLSAEAAADLAESLNGLITVATLRLICLPAHFYSALSVHSPVRDLELDIDGFYDFEAADLGSLFRSVELSLVSLSYPNAHSYDESNDPFPLPLLASLSLSDIHVAGYIPSMYSASPIAHLHFHRFHPRYNSSDDVFRLLPQFPLLARLSIGELRTALADLAQAKEQMQEVGEWCQARGIVFSQPRLRVFEYEYDEVSIDEPIEETVEEAVEEAEDQAGEVQDPVLAELAEEHEARKSRNERRRYGMRKDRLRRATKLSV